MLKTYFELTSQKEILATAMDLYKQNKKDKLEDLLLQYPDYKSIILLMLFWHKQVNEQKYN